MKAIYITDFEPEEVKVIKLEKPQHIFINGVSIKNHIDKIEIRRSEHTDSRRSELKVSAFDKDIEVANVLVFACCCRYLGIEQMSETEHIYVDVLSYGNGREEYEKMFKKQNQEI